MCRLQWASGAMGAAQVSGVRPGRGLRDRPGQRPREPDARQCFSVSLPPQAGAGQPAGAGAGCPFVHLSGSAAPSLRELSRYSSGFSTPGAGSHRDLCLWGSEPVRCDSLYLPVGLSNLGDGGA